MPLPAPKPCCVGRISSGTRPQGRLPTESQNPDKRDALRAYLIDRNFSRHSPAWISRRRLIESPAGKGPYLLAEYRESASAPTVLIYGHGDVVDGMAGEWRDNLDPWRTTQVGQPRLWPGHGRQQGPAQHQHGGACAPCRRRAAEARLQCQIHRRDRRGNRLAGFAGGVPATARRVESRSAARLRRPAAVGRASDAVSRLPRRHRASIWT